MWPYSAARYSRSDRVELAGCHTDVCANGEAMTRRSGVPSAAWPRQPDRALRQPPTGRIGCVDAMLACVGCGARHQQWRPVLAPWVYGRGWARLSSHRSTFLAVRSSCSVRICSRAVTNGGARHRDESEECSRRPNLGQKPFGTVGTHIKWSRKRIFATFYSKALAL